MTTTIDTVWTEPTRASAGRDRTSGGPVGRRIVDVSELEPAEVRQYAREAESGVHFERKGGRTFLVAGRVATGRAPDPHRQSRARRGRPATATGDSRRS